MNQDNMNLELGGVKFDSGKVRMDLLAPEWIEGIAEILTIGSSKYAERNWEMGMRYGRVFASMMRHLWAWWRGEQRDSESGKSHLLHASCCLMFLVAYERRGMSQFDDRPVSKTNWIPVHEFIQKNGEAGMIGKKCFIGDVSDRSIINSKKPTESAPSGLHIKRWLGRPGGLYGNIISREKESEPRTWNVRLSTEEFAVYFDDEILVQSGLV